MLRSLPPALVILIGSIILWSCSSAVDPQPQENSLSVDTITGHTTIDTANLRERMVKHLAHGRDNRDIPLMVHLIEVEEIGDEAVTTFLNTYSNGIDVLADIADDEKSQSLALRIIIDVMDIDHPDPEIGVGSYHDEKVSAVWRTYVADGMHTNAVDALVAITKIFEFQLKQVIDTRPQFHSRAATYAVGMMYGMNANHFRSMYRYLKSATIPYSPSFLTQEEFDEETSVSSYIQFTDGLGSFGP